MFNDGILEIYKKIPQKSEGGNAMDVLVPYTTAFYGEIGFTTEEYYAAKQAETSIDKRVRIHQDKSVCNKHVIVVDSVQYEVGRTYSGVVKGVAVTDITLERVTANYDIA